MAIKILIVEDNRDTLRIYGKALKRRIKIKYFGKKLSNEEKGALIEIEEAETVRQAFEKLKIIQFDLIIVDLKIKSPSGEEMGGLEVISESLKISPLCPIIVITGYGSIELAIKTLTQGVFDFIEKSPSGVDDLVSAVQRAIIKNNEKVLRSGNPFTKMSNVDPKIFGGRNNELEFFKDKLDKALNTGLCEHFLILGNWGIGKSTLLREFKNICQGSGNFASIVPLEPLLKGTSVITAARSIMEGILRDIPYSVEIFKKLKKYYNSIGISVLGTGFQISKDTTKEVLSPQAFIHDSLLSLWQDLKDKTGILVILLDDLDNFIEVSEIIMTIRSVLSMDSIRKTKILFGITSPPEIWQKVTYMKRHHPLSRYFMSRIELGPLNKEELVETIIKSLSETGVTFSPEIIKRVYEYTQGHPFEMQVLCNHLFSNQLSRQVKDNVWDKSLQASLKDLGIAIFDYWFQQASEDEAKTLSIISQVETNISVKEIQTFAKTKTTDVSLKNIPKYLQRLVEKNLISKTGRGLYNISDNMFRAYIKSYY